MPDDVSILNIGADEILNDVYPKLDVYSTPGKKLAVETTKMIEKVLNGSFKNPCQVYLDCEYVAGDSLKTIG